MLDPGPVHVRSVVDTGEQGHSGTVAQGLFFLPVLQLSHAIITRLVLHNHLLLHDDLNGTGARDLES